jgi:uncharacterized OB-fold protein
MTETPTRFISPGPHSEFYWTSGADGRLRVHGCRDCGRLHHPPSPVCPYCHSRDVEPTVIAGTGTVAGFTICHKQFMPDPPVPFAFAFVEIDEDPTIRLTGNVVGCDLGDIAVGMRVQVTFEENGEWFVPLWRPETPAEA